MRPERMLTLTLICKNEDKEQIINRLAAMKLLHITDHHREQVGAATIDIGSPAASAETLSAALITARNLLAKLPRRVADASDIPLANRVVRIQELGADFSTHEQELSTSIAALQHIDTQLLLLDQLPNDEPLTILSAKSTASALIKRTEKDRAILQALRPLYLKENEHSAFIILERERKGELDRFERIDLSPIAACKGTPREAAAALMQERRVASATKQHHETEVASFAAHAPFLAASEPILALELLKAQAPLHFGTTKHLTIIKGFVPVRRQQELARALEEMGAPTLSEFTVPTEAPVALENPKSAKSFESLIALYTLPRYNEIDPTSLMAITFPIFFGFMLGDIGYGLCALILAYIIKQKVEKVRPLANIFLLSAISTILFGFIFGEFFGAEQMLGMQLPHLIHRINDMKEMFLIAVTIGILHLNLGLVLGMINESHEGWGQAIVKKGSWMLLQAGVLIMLAALGMFKDLPVLSAIHVPLMVGVVCTALAIAGIWYGERIRGVVEIFSIFSNIMSYTRLVALGLASVYLALVVNQISGEMFTKGGVWLLLGIIILVIGHAVNLVLGLLGPFLHSLRLHYVEFFMKFYEGGGKEYHPFGAQSVQS